MSQFSCNLKDLESVVCKIIIKNKNGQCEHGSGVIVQSQDKKIYILTAKHCILGKELDYKLENISINILINEVDSEIMLNDEDKHNILLDDIDSNDIAIIVLDKKNYKILSQIKYMNLLDEQSIPIECSFRGYPAPYNIGQNNRPVTIGMCTYIENNILSTSTKLDNTVYDDALYNLSGCSGGAVFTFYKDNIYIVGIVYEFDDLFQRIRVNALGQYNKLLKDLGYKELKLENYYSDKDISLMCLKKAFQKNKASWLNNKYIPDLHCVGYIEKICAQIIQNSKFANQIYAELMGISDKLKKTCEYIEYCTDDDRFNSVKVELNNIKSYWIEIENYTNSILYNIKNNIKLDERINLDYNISTNVLEQIKNLEQHNYRFYNARRLREKIDEVVNISVEQKLINIIEIFNTQFTIFLGEPGTGKTDALSNFVNTQLEDNSVSILIEAKQFEEMKSWKDIMISALGLSSNFDEDDIWNALNNEAIRCENSKSELYSKEEFIYCEKVVICVDAIDECINKENWLNRIRELDIICEKFPRLRFILSSRPYVFKNQHIKNKKEIPLDGDVNVEDIFDKYISKYNIRFEDENLRKRIKWTIKTPFSLKLFCENYEDHTINNSEKISVTINKLLACKIDRIDTEINKMLNNKWSQNQYIIRSLLLCLVDNLISNSKNKIEQEEIINILKNNSKTCDLDQSTKVKILECLCNYGLIYSRIEENKDDLLAVPKVYYEITYQTLIDYLLSIKLTNIEFRINKEFPKILESRIGAQQLLSLYLLEERGILIGLNDVWFDYYDKYELLKLQLFAISNVTIEKALEYKTYVSKLFKSNTKNLRTVVNNLVMNVSKIPNHPFNGMFVHEILMEYKTPVDRDIIWSSPEIMPYTSEEIWYGQNPCICTANLKGLTIEDNYDGLPLVYAWTLTNLDNRIRENSKNELTKWGIENPNEFVKLLKISYKTNDPQMQEDLLLCTVGIISSRKIDDSSLKELSEWILENIFDVNKIQDNKNAIIRFAGRVILEDAFKKGLICTNEVNLARPPYKLNKEIYIEMNKDVIDKGEDSYTPIIGDLGWYVIDNAFKGFFEYDKELTEEEKKERLKSQKDIIEFFKKMINGERNFDDNNVEDYTKLDEEEVDNILLKGVEKINNDENKNNENEVYISKYSLAAQNFLKEHAKLNGKDKISPKVFAISVAIQYLQNNGWIKEKVNFIGEKQIGYDIAISKQYMSATHGSRSIVMTTAEKYVWCAINEIKGYLADRLPYYGYGDDEERRFTINNYSVFLNINNTFLMNNIMDKKAINENSNPYLPNVLSKSLEGLDNDNIENMTEWINKAEFPNFYDWVKGRKEAINLISDELNKSSTCLYNYTVLQEKKTHVDSILWINAFIISNNDYDIFQKQIELEPKKFYEMFIKSNDDGASYPNTECYVDPVSVVTQDWISDLDTYYNMDYNINQHNGNYKIYKTSSKITYELLDLEEEVRIPSKIIRDLLKIYSTEGVFYRNLDNSIVAFNIRTDNLNCEGQEILYVDTEEIEKRLCEKNYKMFWIIKVLRQPSLEARDKNKDFFHNRYCTWIATDNPFNIKLLCDEPKLY